MYILNNTTNKFEMQICSDSLDGDDHPGVEIVVEEYSRNEEKSIIEYRMSLKNVSTGVPLGNMILESKLNKFLFESGRTLLEVLGWNESRLVWDVILKRYL